MKLLRNVVKGVSKAIKGVAKGVKKAVKGASNIVKKAWRNKWIRTALLITAAVMLPPAIAAIGPATGALAAGTLANGAITGAIIGGGSGVLDGDKPSEWLSKGAVSAATATAFTKLSQTIKGVSNTDVMKQGQLERLDLLQETKKTGDSILGVEDIDKAIEEQVASIDELGGVETLTSDLEKVGITRNEEGKFTSQASSKVKEDAIDFASQTAMSTGSSLLNVGIQSQLLGDPRNVGAYGAGLPEEGPANLTPLQVSYQEAGINIADAYRTLSYGPGDIGNYDTELFKQETIQVS